MNLLDGIRGSVWKFRKIVFGQVAENPENHFSDFRTQRKIRKMIF